MNRREIIIISKKSERCNNFGVGDNVIIKDPRLGNVIGRVTGAQIFMGNMILNVKILQSNNDCYPIRSTIKEFSDKFKLYNGVINNYGYRRIKSIHRKRFKLY